MRTDSREPRLIAIGVVLGLIAGVMLMAPGRSFNILEAVGFTFIVLGALAGWAGVLRRALQGADRADDLEQRGRAAEIAAYRDAITAETVAVIRREIRAAIAGEVERSAQ